jgi:predicted dinucleotide-binding enzyme
VFRNGVGDRPLGIVGAGKAGTAIARAAVAGGYDVAISGSGSTERIEPIVEVLAPGARSLTTEEVVRHADLIVLAIPLHRYRGYCRRTGRDEVPGPFATAPAATR